MKQIRNRKFTSALSTGFFFGLVSTAISVLTFNLPLQQTYIDFICAIALLICVLASVYFIQMITGAENFYRLFVSSFITFCVAMAGMFGYLELAKGGVQAQWLTLLSGGAIASFTVAFLANLMRRQKST